MNLYYRKAKADRRLAHICRLLYLLHGTYGGQTRGAPLLQADFHLQTLRAYNKYNYHSSGGMVDCIYLR